MFYFSQFKRVLLSALGQMVLENLPEEYEAAKYMAKKNSDPSKKLTAAIDLYRSRIE